MASETTAAATGAVGVVRRDPMAMKPFCGYNFGDYFAHWLSFGHRDLRLPKVFHVNWFRKGADGRFLWPGFGDNLRVLEWIVGRCRGSRGALETPVGLLPRRSDLDLSGLSLPEAALDMLLSVDVDGFLAEYAAIGAYLDEFGNRVPGALRLEHRKALGLLEAAAGDAPRAAVG
jgi:phosphoenolpyruvate carboxykinase (GTP)